jgi:hypothetical protein
MNEQTRRRLDRIRSTPQSTTFKGHYVRTPNTFTLSLQELLGLSLEI